MQAYYAYEIMQVKYYGKKFQKLIKGDVVYMKHQPNNTNKTTKGDLF